MAAAARLLAAAVALAPVSVAAQAYQCTLPRGPVALPPAERGREVRARIVGYTLAASWSPEYCRTRSRSPADARQCSGREGRFGMILHGLWPQGAGRSPQWCATARRPTADDVRPNLCATPSARLLGHEWARHGSCMARRPATYFAIQRLLWTRLRWPDFDRLSRKQGLVAGDVRQAVADANPGWSPAQVGVEITPRGWLAGVRLCHDRTFAAAACPQSERGPRDKAAVAIWRGL